MSTEISEEDCKFCNKELKKNYNLNIVCNNYVCYYNKPLDKNIVTLLNKIFKLDKFYLPTEIIEIIFKQLEEKKTNKISKINANSVLHFGKCDICSSKLIEFYSKNVCHKHYLPRCIFPEDF